MCKDNTVALKVKAYKKLKAQRDELDLEITKLENWLKDEMTSRGIEILEGEGYQVTWKTVTSNRFDQSNFKSVHPELFESFKFLSESRRFSVK